MTNTLDAFLRGTIGFNDLLAEPSRSTFPPYNIEKITDDEYRLTFAVAGYSSSDIEVSVDRGYLVVKGSRENPETIYLHQGIAFRNFHQRIKLAQYIDVTTANITNGLLVIDLQRIIPEEDRPRVIPVG